MLKLAPVPDQDHHADAPEAPRAPRVEHRYYAFLSYSHKDEETADWLHSQLEKFRVPSALAGKLTANGVIPKRLTPIFRDRHELAAADDLGAEIRNALASSQYLIVLCSPAAARSRWTNAEIEAFKRTRPDGCVLAAIVEGEPFASDIAGHEGEECFPPALTQKYDRRGRPTGKRSEPLAADLRESGDGRRMGFLKLVAGMLGVGLDELVQRETTRRQRRLAWLAAASLGGMAVTSSLAIWAVQSRDEARDQRREAEGLVGFMLGDLREKLEPIGRLDALDAVGSRALAYFEKQDKSELSDDALAQRSRALTLLGEIAILRGDLDGAMRRYREATASTGETARRYPDDPQRLFDHAQNVYWIGEIAARRGQIADAERAWSEYKRLADQMVALGPANRKWRMEVKYANTNLGILLYQQRRFPEAAQRFQVSLTTIESLAASEPANSDYQTSLVESLAWLGDAQYAEGKLDEAIGKRERQVALLDRWMRLKPNDTGYRWRAITANRALGRFIASKGDLSAGIDYGKKAVQLADQLLPTEPTNTDWIEFSAGARLDLGRTLRAAGRVEEASTQIRAGCDATERLLAADSTVPTWRTLNEDCLHQRAVLALRSGATDEAMLLAQRAFASARSSQAKGDVAGIITTAREYKLIGDIWRQRGNRSAAVKAWQSGLAIWPKSTPELPRETEMRVELLKALGRTAEAEALEHKLGAIGFRGSH